MNKTAIDQVVSGVGGGSASSSPNELTDQEMDDFVDEVYSDESLSNVYNHEETWEKYNKAKAEFEIADTKFKSLKNPTEEDIETWLDANSEFASVDVPIELLKVSDTNEQLDNVINTGVNGLISRFYTSLTGAGVASADVALKAGAAGVHGFRSMLLKDYNFYKSTGSHFYSDSTRGIGKCATQINWDKYSNFEEALKAEGKKCFGQ